MEVLQAVLSYEGLSEVLITHREPSPQPPPTANEEPGPLGVQSAGE